MASTPRRKNAQKKLEAPPPLVLPEKDGKEEKAPLPPPDDVPHSEGEKKKKKKKKHHHHNLDVPDTPGTPGTGDESSGAEPELPPPPAGDDGESSSPPPPPPPAEEDEPELPPPLPSTDEVPPALPPDDDAPPPLPPDEDDDEGKKKKKHKHKHKLDLSGDGSSGDLSPVVSDDQSAPLSPVASARGHHHRKSSRNLSKGSRKSMDCIPDLPPLPDSGHSSALNSPTMTARSPLKESVAIEIADHAKSSLGESEDKPGPANDDSSSSDTESDIPPPPPPLEGDEYSNDDDLKGASDEELPPLPEVAELKAELKKKKKKKHKKKKHSKKNNDDDEPDLPPVPPDDIGPPPPVDIGPPPIGPPPVGDIPPPSLDIGPPPLDIPPPPCSKYPVEMMKKRFHVVNEILSTERTYVSQLNLMVTMFVDKADCGLNPDQILQVFANVKVIATCHVAFLTPLEQRVKTWTEESIISDLFLEARWIKLYKHYINQYDTAARHVKDWRESVKPFKKYLKETEWTPALQCTNLEGLLVTPIQRLPRYVLLLEEMAKCTPEDHPDSGKINDAIAVIRELTDYVNKCKKESDSTGELRAMEAKFTGLPFELVQTHRALVKEGPMKIDKEAAHFWLFSDIAFITKPPSRGKYKFKESVNLNTAKLQQMEGTSFKIFSTDGMVNAQCGSVEEKQLWFQALTDTINAAQKKMLNEAFTNETVEAEGSKQFNEIRLAKMAENRSLQFKALLQSEKEYLHVLDETRTTFFVPIKKVAKDKVIPVLTVGVAKDIMSNSTELRNVHKAIMKALKAKDPWTNESTVSDIFSEHLERIIYLYRNYIEQHAVQMATLNACMKKEEFVRWISVKEIESKLSLQQLLGHPLRRISEYYIALANMLQNTNPKAEDYAKLSEIVSKLSAFNEEFTLKNKSQLLELSSSSRRTPRGSFSKKT